MRIDEKIDEESSRGFYKCKDVVRWYLESLDRGFPGVDFEVIQPRTVAGRDWTKVIDELTISSPKEMDFVFRDRDITKKGHKLAISVWTKDIGRHGELKGLDSISKEMEWLCGSRDALKQKGYDGAEFVKSGSYESFCLGYHFEIQGEGSPEYIRRVFEDFRDACVR